jgi:two-component system OmpR family response regulator/two-component system response regulator RstA
MSSSNTKSVLLVEDDPDLASMVAEFLRGNGFDVAIESRGDSAVDRILSDKPDAVILDINLPGKEGFEVCREVRSEYKGPILILTARGDEVDEVIGLELGADDYMSKPVRPRVLLARLRSHLRKAPTDVEDSGVISVGDLSIDSGRRHCEIAGKEIDLTTAEFDLLWNLAKNVGEVVSRESIYMELVGIPYDGIDRSIDLRVSRLRKRLGDDPANPTRIKSVRGVGYILVLQK